MWLKKFCDTEKKNGIIIPLQQANVRVTKAVGKSERTIRHIRKDFRIAEEIDTNIVTPRKVRKKQEVISLDDFDKCTVRWKFLEYHEIKKEITLGKLLNMWKVN